ncbi:MAG: FKBP-type peptidyl-prolyl cis-trans isomerase [Cyclobacteriaceae bacterium]|nr:FKBP-type peptidyl-prolyl cis-trans isomerase [Cyclobacteriaceae bacterium]
MRVAKFIPLFLLVLGCAQPFTPPCTEEVDPAEIAAVPADRLQIDLDIIDDTLAARSIVPIIDPSGIRYTIEKQGDGEDVRCLQNAILVRYKGKLLSPDARALQFGGIFDQGTINISLSTVILGWQVMFMQFKAGTKATLYLPSGFAYGTSSRPAPLGSGRADIPANANLIFEIELLDVQ